MNGQRRISAGATIINTGAKRAQCIDKVADRPLVHARHTGQGIFTATNGQCRGKRAKRRPGIAQKQFGRLDAKGAPSAVNHNYAVGALLHRHAQLFQRGQHDAGVIRGKQAVQSRLPRRKCGQQQRSIGNALGSGQAHRAGDVANRLKVKMVHVDAPSNWPRKSNLPTAPLASRAFRASRASFGLIRLNRPTGPTGHCL